MAACDGDEARVYGADNAGTGATAGQIPSAWDRLAFLSPRTSRSPMALSRGLCRHPGGGGHNGDDDGGGGGDSGARGRIAEAGVYGADNADAGTVAEQFAHA